jgi:WG containing repeat
MKQHTLKSALRNCFCFVFSLSSTFAFSQTPAGIIKSVKNNVEQLPYVKNLAKNSGIHFFEAPREGYQVAALNGQFGYVSRIIDWMIPPQYDYAYPFHEGFAIVFLDGQPMYIDKQNRQPFKTEFAKHLGHFHNGRALFKTLSGKMGILDTKGRVVTDTIFRKIYLFDEDKDRRKYPKISKPRTATVAISHQSHLTESVNEVQGKKITTKNIEYDYAIIDTNGRFLVPLGAFRTIEPHQNGFATAHNGAIEVLFDSDGKEVFRYNIEEKRDWRIYTPMQVKADLIQINFHNPTSDNPFEGHYGLLNFKGEVVFKDTTALSFEDYDDKKALIRTDDGWKIVFFDIQKQPSESPNFSNAPNLDNLKKYGCDAASITLLEKSKWGIIDSCLNWKIRPQYDRIYFDTFRNPHFRLTNMITSEEAEKRQLKPRFGGVTVALEGLADLSGKVIFEPQFGQISPKDSTFKKFDFSSVDGKKFGVMDRNGQILKESENYVDTSSMQTPPRSVSQVYSKDDYKIKINDADCKDEIHEELGVTKRCNSYKKIVNPVDNASKMAQIIFSESDTIYAKKQQYSAKLKVIKAQLVNTTKDTIFFQTDADELQITIQARDKKGVWRDISAVRNLSPYQKRNPVGIKSLGLPPQSFWDIQLPTYAGVFKTQCRAIIKTDKKDAALIVSKEWSAGINPAQFWKSPMYAPERIFRTYGDIYEQED